MDFSNTKPECFGIETHNEHDEEISILSSNSLNFGIKTYFQNLYDYSPINSHGSCGYISFIQYLSYYDTFYNEMIIPSKYERGLGNVTSVNTALADSPGVLRQSYPMGKNTDKLYQFIQQNKDVDFQMHLMDIHNLYYQKTPTQYECSIGMWDYNILLDSLFNDIDVEFNYVNKNTYSLFGSLTDARVVNGFDSYVKQHLDSGEPVMLHIYRLDNGKIDENTYHSVVAYYYDNNGIHANFGWGINDTDIVLNPDYVISEAGVMNLSNIPFTHTKKYIVNDVSYCGCGLHLHTYNHNYQNDGTTHTAFCACGASTSVNHSYTHRYKRKDGTSHYSYCVCGRYTTGGHVINGVLPGNQHAICILCKGLAEIGFIEMGLSEIMSNRIITANGSYILPSGIIVLSDADYQGYLNGTFVIPHCHDIAA